MDVAKWSLGIRQRLPATVRWPLDLLAGAVARWVGTGGSQLGAAIAFYTMFAVAPLLVVAIAIAGAVFGPDAARGQIVAQIQGLVGQAAAHDIEAMIQSAWRHPASLWASALGIGTLLIGASGVFAMLRFALNAINQAAPPPSALGAFVRARLIGFALVLGFGFLAITSLLLSAALAAVRTYLSFVSLGVAELLSLLDFALSTAVLSVAFAALLRWLPDVAPSRRAVWVGAVVSAVLFAVGKHLIGLYLAHASVASAYGAAGSFVVVMLWVYYSAQILLFGGALGAELDERAGQDARPGGTSFARPAAGVADQGDKAMPHKPQDSRHTRTSSGPSLRGEPAPRLPHEHDESGDSQVSGPREVIHQAKRDIDAGLVDTDRGPPMDETYRRTLKRPA